MHRPGHRPQLGDFHLRAGGELGVRSVWGVLSRMHLGDTRVETSSGPWGAWLWSLRKIDPLPKSSGRQLMVLSRSDTIRLVFTKAHSGSTVMNQSGSVC